MSSFFFFKISLQNMGEKTTLYGTMELESSHSQWLKNWNFCTCYCEVLGFAYSHGRCLKQGRSTIWVFTATGSRADILCVRERRGMGGGGADIWRQEDLADTSAWSRQEWILKGYSGSGWCPQESFSRGLTSLSHCKAHEEVSAGPIHGRTSKGIFSLLSAQTR